LEATMKGPTFLFCLCMCITLQFGGKRTIVPWHMDFLSSCGLMIWRQQHFVFSGCVVFLHSYGERITNVNYMGKTQIKKVNSNHKCKSLNSCVCVVTLAMVVVIVGLCR
jgi:hypothetical protein